MKTTLLTCLLLMTLGLGTAASAANMVPYKVYDGKQTYDLTIPEGYDVVPREEPYPGFDECVSTHPNGMRNAWTPCYKKAAEYWDNELNTAYKAAMKNCGENKQCKNDLRNAEREWIKWRDLQLAVMKKHHSNEDTDKIAYRHLYEIYKLQAKIVSDMSQADVSDYK